MYVAVPVPHVELRLVRHPAFENRREGIGIDRTRKPERLRALAHSGARLSVRGVVPGVLAVPLETGDALGSRSDLTD